MGKEVTAKEIEQIMEPYIKISGSARFLPENDVDNAIDEISTKLDNVFANVQDCGKGVKKLVVGKMAKVHMVPKYEIFIR